MRMIQAHYSPIKTTTQQNSILKTHPTKLLFGTRPRNTSQNQIQGQLYTKFSQTPAGALHQFLKKLKPRFDLEHSRYPKPQLTAYLENVRARYGLHLNGAVLIKLKLDVISKVLSSPQTSKTVLETLENPSVQKVMLFFHPNQQLHALETLLEDPKEFVGFAKGFSDPIFQQALQSAKSTLHPFHRLFFEPRPQKTPALINHFQKLYALLRPTVQTSKKSGLSEQISMLYFPPREPFASQFYPIFGTIKNLDAQERLLQLAVGKDPGNRMRYNTLVERHQHQGGKELIGFFNAHDPSGEKTAQVLKLMMGDVPFQSDSDRRQFNQTLQRFLTLGSQWILQNSQVASPKKAQDLTYLMREVKHPVEFSKAWQEMASRYPLLPSANIDIEHHDGKES